MSKSSMVRNLTLLQKIPFGIDMAISTSQLHTDIVNEGFKVTKRTVERDLQSLSEITSIDYIEEQSRKRWYHINEYPSKFKQIQPSEALLLKLSQKRILDVISLGEQSILDQRFQRSSDILANNGLENFCSKIHVVPDVLPFIETEITISTADRKTIFNALQKEFVLSLSYQSAKHDQAKSIQVNPLALIIRPHSHYLVATKTKSPEFLQLFLLNRIKSVENAYIPISKPTEFVVQEYIDSNPTGWVLSEDKAIELIQLKVKNFPLEHLKRNRLAKDQIIKTIDDNWSLVSFEMVPTYDLVAWILKYGSDVECLSPTSLRKRIVDTLQRTLAHYNHGQS